jgi:small subunit ribosomal protein S2
MARKKETKEELANEAIVEEKKEEAEEEREIEEEVESSKKSKKKLEKEAEHEAHDPTLEEKKRKVLEKAKKLLEGAEVKSEELKEQVKGEKRTDMLVPLEDYINSGIYIGTKVVTPDMRKYVYRRRADGLAIFNTDLIDEKIKEGIKYLGQFKPSEVVLVCKRQAGWKAAEKFGEITGIRVFTKKYPAGILTNSNLSDFFENELTIVSDSWVDKNALNDTLNVHKKVLMICDTNNFSNGANQTIIGNNKSSKSLGIIFYLLTKGYCEAHKPDSINQIPGIDWWVGEQGSSEEEAKKKARAGAKFGV